MVMNRRLEQARNRIVFHLILNQKNSISERKALHLLERGTNIPKEEIVPLFTQMKHVPDIQRIFQFRKFKHKDGYVNASMVLRDSWLRNFKFDFEAKELKREKENTVSNR